MSKILLVEDDPDIRRLVAYKLTRGGFTVIEAADGVEALGEARREPPDLIILDVRMPRMSGLDVCRELRAGAGTAQVPIIILSARTSDVDKIAGLQFGADDYVTKPFNPVELVARVQSVLRRSARKADAPPVQNRVEVADLVIDLDERTASVDGESIQLRPKEFDLLLTLARFPGFAMDRDRLLDLVWGSRYYGDQRTVDVHVAWLREKLSRSRLKIQTVWGVGYKLVEAADEPARPRKRT